MFPEFLELVKAYDIVCLSETKLCDVDEIYLPGYVGFFRNRGKYRRRSGGIFVKEHIADYISVFENRSMISSVNEKMKYYSFTDVSLPENILSMKLEGLVFKEAVTVGAVYIPPEGSTYANTDFFVQLQDCIVALGLNNLCLLGDFNARTGTLNDIIEGDVNDGLDVLFEGRIQQSNIPRRLNTDCGTNNMGFRLVDFCKEMGGVMVNGRVGVDGTCGRAITCDM
ncbi:hypothetical protein BaRGS_00009507 [Batillaria attramentaria]|uniref:Endonuclease/exonuclease/phosphatase domain-containing protein n=1 Tax=Batillaria attramentaria TaxID=370345 RepID=A0ABD0LI67_9CAEN